ncbi:MAG TPA: hypothetical protein VLL52_06020 [Anaerolineae bacterium]|nr:hypothetical protein [Anaerolineae bacterium]
MSRSNISDELHKRCLKLMLKIDILDSDSGLKSLFVTLELKPYRNDIRDATDKKQRILYLIELGVKKEILPSILSMLLSTQEEETQIYLDLKDLIHDIKLYLNSSRTLPIVIVAMTREQAQFLLNEKFSGNRWITSFDTLQAQQIQDYLKNSSINQEAILSHYGISPEDWKPDLQNSRTIKDVLTSFINNWNSHNHDTLQISVEHYTSSFLTDLDNNYINGLKAWRWFHQTGGIVIIDAFSLYHPMIARQLLQTEISANPKIALSVMQTFPYLANVNTIQSILNQSLMYCMPNGYLRSETYMDESCDFCLINTYKLNAWLQRLLPKFTVEKCQPPNFETLDEIAKQLPPQQMNKLPWTHFGS